MKSSLPLLALLGLASALQHGLEYEYIYESRIATGIPEIQRQHAGAALRASVTVQLLGDDLMSQISNIEVADMNGLTECDSKASLPLTYEPMVDHVGVFQEPFLINGTDSLVVPQDEPYWITNIRKAVATLFTAEPLRTHGNELDGLLQTQAFLDPAVVVDEEQSLAGICQHRYVLTKLPDYLKEEHVEYIEMTVEEDVQSDTGHFASSALKSKGGHGKGSKSSTGGKGTSKGGKGGKLRVDVPKLGDDVYVLSRVINFDKCQTLVKFQNYGYGIYCKMGTSQCGTLLSRSSTGSFTLRGSPDALRIEKVEIEGNVLMNPLGYETEKIRTVTNQILKLKAVRHQRTPLTLPDSTRRVDSFMYEVESPVSSVRDAFHPSVHHQPMRQDKPHGFYPLLSVSGLPAKHFEEMQPKIVDQIKDILLELKKDLEEFGGKEEKHSNIADRTNILVDLIMILDYDNLEKLFNSFDANNEHENFMRDLLVDTMTKAGTDAAVRVLVEQIKSRTIGAERSVQVFMGLTNSLQMPDHSFPHLLELLKSLDMTKEFDLTSSLVLNMATAINRLCLIPLADDTQQKLLLGHRYCNPRVILAQFLPIVKKGLQNDNSASHRMVYLHALIMMNTAKKVSILKPIIIGSNETDIRVRSLACYALQAYNTPARMVKEVYKILMPVFEYQGEHHMVRIAAIGSLLTWKPDTAWWHRLAVASWRDPSRQMQSYISHIIRSVAERHGEKFDTLRQRARHVLPMTKHFPSSKRFSMSFLIGAYLETIETGVILNSEWIHTMKKYFPTVLHEVIIEQQGSFLNHLFEYVLSGDIDKIYEYGFSGRRYIPDIEDISSRIAKGMYNEALMALRMDEYTHFDNLETPNDSSDEYILATRLFYNVQRIFKMDFRQVVRLFSFPPPSWSLMKFINPVQIFVSFPTDIGLPFVGTVTTPSVFFTNGEIDLNPPVWHTNIFASLKVQTKAQVITPWNAKAITSGFEVRKDLSLPSLSVFYIKLAVNFEEKNKVSIVRCFSHPFTVRAPFILRLPLSEEKDFKIIHNRSPPFKNTLSLGKEITGIALDVEWIGDVKPTFNQPRFEKFPESLGDLFSRGMKSTLQHYEFRVTFDPERSTTSGIRLSFLLFRTQKRTKDPYSQFHQEGQYDDNSQQTDEFQEFQDPHGEVDQVETVIGGQYSINDSYEERGRKLEESAQQMEFAHVECFSGGIEFIGTESHKYEVVATWPFSYLRGAFESVSSHITFLMGTNNETDHMTCLEVQYSRPQPSPLMDLSDTLDHDLESKFSLKMRVGESCSAAPVVEIKASVDMTQQRKDLILSTLESGDFCAKDLQVQEHIQAVYDSLHAHVSWNQDLLQCSPLMDFTYGLNGYLETSLFPLVSHNYCQAKNDPGVLTIDATRSIDNNLWDIWMHKPTETSLINHLRLPDFVYDLASFDHNYHHTTHGIALIHDECHVYEDHVDTFDGTTYPLERSLCWRVLAMDVKQHESWMLLHRYVEYPEPGIQLRFINPMGMIVADITSDEIKVNGKLVIMARDREVVRYKEMDMCIVEVYKDQIFVEFPDILAVSLKDSHVAVKMDMYNTGGLCGARDGEVTGDLQGPNQCVYYNPELFSASWTAGGDGGCDSFAMDDLVAKVEDYQQHCPKFQSQATGPAHDWYIIDEK
ncbi:hemolymph clottable protein-like [Oratosquilla oratoria]|uniref:hemolymph clottable protein-like n=1 Tax=Oratosquilla oratoria TaxID=337810 RepID=UPI003F7591DE